VEALLVVEGWNTVRVHAIGPTIALELNGTKTIDFIETGAGPRVASSGSRAILQPPGPEFRESAMTVVSGHTARPVQRSRMELCLAPSNELWRRVADGAG
jgi:hypothetical protein